MPRASDSASPLSVQRAFVVQFRAAARIEAGRVTGRVEHIASRTATDFDTLEDLLAFFHELLQPSDQNTDKADQSSLRTPPGPAPKSQQNGNA
ncbi:hypothetical protein [Candidatus Entotheonella palauensis]|uniref:hypothetical protein n=1 Tax=Candidatus Entotheonella palauensis TaxID=93172 RepID=UPI000B7FA158|nr:hypothetical protein [Candidatus Entotheonella palauensis]